MTGYSRTRYERLIQETARLLRVPVSRRRVKTMAAHCIAEGRPGRPMTAGEFWRVYGHADPTAAEAIRNIERHQP